MSSDLVLLTTVTSRSSQAVESSSASRTPASSKSRASSSGAEIEASLKQTADAQDQASTVRYMYAPQGLFPQPLPRNVKPAVHSKIKSRFKLLGKFMAKALMDSRMVGVG